MLVGLLGPVEVAGAEGWVRAGTPKQSCVLAALALAPGQSVPVDVLVERLWQAHPPESAYGVVYSCVSRLRGLIGRREDFALTRAGNGAYRLDVSPDHIDLFATRAAAARARAAAASGDHETAVDVWRRAADLWRGTPLAGITGEWATRTRDALRGEQLGILTGRYDSELALGNHERVLGELHGHVADHPRSEGLAAALMLALFRVGRAAEALLCYERLRVQLRDELGQDPGRPLRLLHQRILNEDPKLHRDPAAGMTANRAGRGASLEPTGKRGGPPVRQLPSGITRFTGRAEQLARLDAVLAEHLANPTVASPPITIATVTGAGGTGKTSLAVHWARGVSDRFPDGQLYVNLRGYGSDEPVLPASVLESFLRALEVPGDRIPADTEERAAIFRSIMADRRMLLLLDNARDADQVRPLLPGAGTFVVATSRTRLRGLAAREGAHSVDVAQLDPEESMALLAAAVDPAGLPDAAERFAELARLCGQLPLALAIVAEHVRRRDGDLAGLIDELRDEHDRLDSLDVGDASTDMRAVLSWSYQTLDAEAARMFRLLALYPGDDIGAAAAAAVAGIGSVRRTRRILDRLTDANQLQQKRTGRYELHDLLRVYGRELADRHDTESQRDDAVRRVLQWYLHSACNARAAVDPGSQTLVDPEVVDADVSPQTHDGPQAALTWYDAERANIVAVIRYGATSGMPLPAALLNRAMWTYFELRSAYDDDTLALSRTILDSARRLGDRRAEANAWEGIARSHQGAYRFEESLDCKLRALRVFRQSGDSWGEATVLLSLSGSYGALDRDGEALECLEDSLRISREVGSTYVESIALNNIADHLVRLGRHEEASEAAELSLRLQRRHMPGFIHESAIVDTVGRAYAGLGRHDTAIAHFREALALNVKIGDHRRKANYLTGLGRAQRDNGAVEEARASWEAALTILNELESPEAARLRTEIDSLDD